MIIQLTGFVTFKTEKFLILDVLGVGYKVFVVSEVLRKAPKKEKLTLWTHLRVRDDAMDIYGFLVYSELEFFEQLINISGVGPKTALAILSLAPADVLKKAISTGELSYLTKISGIGKKLAEKIILELRDKIGVFESEAGGVFKEGEDALEALRSLGYTMKEGREILQKIPPETKGTENIIKEALKQMQKK